MADTLLLFSTYPDIPRGGLVAIADSGGERNLLADIAEEVSLEFARLSEKTITKLASIQEYTQEADNPLDPWGTGISFEQIFEDSLVVMLEDENASIGVISQDLRDGYSLSQGCVDALKKTAARQTKPVAFITNLSGVRRAEMTAQVEAFGAPVLVGTHESLRAIRSWLNFRDCNSAEAELETMLLPTEFVALLEKGSPLGERESLSVLSALKLHTLPIISLEHPGDLAAHKGKYPFPVVLKTAAGGVLHKADVGGVVLNIPDYAALEAAYDKMSCSLGPKAVVAPFFDFDTELIFGMITDPIFGPFIVVGAGGIYTEALRDRAVLLPTATEHEIRKKLETLKIYQLLTGLRGSKPADLDALVSQIRKFCAVVAYLSQWVAEIDVNPVAVTGEQIIALDALIIPKNIRISTE
jgi:acyl-CoA synthetase (NDP forming)